LNSDFKNNKSNFRPSHPPSLLSTTTIGTFFSALGPGVSWGKFGNLPKAFDGMVETPVEAEQLLTNSAGNSPPKKRTQNTCFLERSLFGPS